ncbi:MAG: type IV toxin-antitoxin system AbiEi family antitoxin domain-containing protein [Acidobacteriota bacterium]|nr:type IV toxin-antitoxin system AbiEi family antitoxin domain-containing protein [Acidobacteriota bacterium]
MGQSSGFGENTKKVLLLLRSHGILRPRDLPAMGISREMLRHLYKNGLIERAGRGIYRLREQMEEHRSLIEAAKLVPKGVICLLSALRFHEIGTQEPYDIWLALPNSAWRPRIRTLRLRIIYPSGKAFSEGIEVHRYSGGVIRVYNAAKTIADAFKFRNKIGLDAAVEALRDGLRSGKVNRDELWHYAGICRVQKIIKPYIEALS